MSGIAFTPDEGLSPRTVARQAWKREKKQSVLWKCTNADCLTEDSNRATATGVVRKDKAGKIYFEREHCRCPNCGAPMQKYNPYRKR